MFEDITEKIFRLSPDSNPAQLNYGIAVADVDNDGHFEIIVAGFNGPNLVLKWNAEIQQLENIAVDDPSSPFYALRDPQGNAISVVACDIDGDGREEIYFLNTNQAFSGVATYSDKLFKFRKGRYEDILSDPINSSIANYYAGRSVACLDRAGTGRYSIYLANYSQGDVGPHALIEMDPKRSDVSKGIIALKNVASEAGVAKLAGGRGLAVGPIFSNSMTDIFCVNEHGPNFLFRNNGDGTFAEVASESGVSDPYEHGRGLVLADFSGNGSIDIAYGNWNGPHRLCMHAVVNGKSHFRNIAVGTEYEEPSPLRSLVAGDFDNDGNIELFFNNMAFQGPAPNRFFRIVRGDPNQDPAIVELPTGKALEPQGKGTGGIAMDLDGDGRLEMVLSHGESAPQPLSVFHITRGQGYNFLRIFPRTQYGAPARGARIKVNTSNNQSYIRIIDGGSGYLCQTEPVAHFGLGRDIPTSVEITWPDGNLRTIDLKKRLNQLVIVDHPIMDAV